MLFRHKNLQKAVLLVSSTVAPRKWTFLNVLVNWMAFVVRLIIQRLLASAYPMHVNHLLMYVHLYIFIKTFLYCRRISLASDRGYLNFTYMIRQFIEKSGYHSSLIIVWFQFNKILRLKTRDENTMVTWIQNSTLYVGMDASKTSFQFYQNGRTYVHSFCFIDCYYFSTLQVFITINLARKQ